MLHFTHTSVVMVHKSYHVVCLHPNHVFRRGKKAAYMEKTLLSCDVTTEKRSSSEAYRPPFALLCGSALRSNCRITVKLLSSQSMLLNPCSKNLGVNMALYTLTP